METRPAWPEKESRASALSVSARSLIETCQPASQPVGGRPVNHSRIRNLFDEVTGIRPAGSSILVNAPLGLWEIVGAAGFQAAMTSRAQSERVSARGDTFHSRRALHCRPWIRLSATSSPRVGPRRRGPHPLTPGSPAAGRRLQTRRWFHQPSLSLRYLCACAADSQARSLSSWPIRCESLTELAPPQRVFIPLTY